jgi:Tol biopolymer transport system component
MKIKIKNVLGAALALLITFGASQRAATAQTTVAARIAYTAPVTDRKSGQTSYQIFSMNPDGSTATQLTRSGGFFPSWSRSQKYIAFHRAAPTENKIYVMDAIKGEIKGGRTFAVVNASGTGHDFSPDDTKLLFTGPDSAANGLWLVSVNLATGAVGTPVLLHDGACFAPRFSPDGTKIAYYRSGIVRVLDLTTQAEITFTQSNTAPSWSPDGTKIAFGGIVCYGDNFHCHSEIVIANADGTAWTPVTALQSSSSWPAWSPDGTQIAFFSQVSGSKAIYKTAIGSGTVTLLYNGGQESLDWNP